MMKLAAPQSLFDQRDITLRIGCAVQRQEYALAQKIGHDALDAHILAWAAYDTVIDIASNSAPEFYQTTEAKMIRGRA